MYFRRYRGIIMSTSQAKTLLLIWIHLITKSFNNQEEHLVENQKSFFSRFNYNYLYTKIHIYINFAEK